MSHPIPQPVQDRIFDRVAMGPNNCWISTYSVTDTGYPRVLHTIDSTTKRQRAFYVHRVAYTAVNGPIPDDMTVDHTCFEKRCINPDHLRLLSNVENAMTYPDRPDPINFCLNGHDRRVVGVYRGKPGGPGICAECARQKSERHRAKKRIGG